MPAAEQEQGLLVRTPARALAVLTVATWLVLLPAGGLWLKACRGLFHVAMGDGPALLDAADVFGALTFTLGASALALSGAYVLRAVVLTVHALRRARLIGTRAETGGCELLVVPDERPFAWASGVLRPAIVVSAATRRALQPRELEAVLDHERSHVRHRDALRYLVLGAARRAVFFLPVAADLEYRARLAAEFRADRETSDEDALADALLRLARSSADVPHHVPAATTTLIPRLERLAEPDTVDRHLRVRVTRALASATILSSVVTASMLFLAGHGASIAQAGAHTCPL